MFDLDSQEFRSFRERLLSNTYVFPLIGFSE
nr:hypothetical protein Iba_chr05dCG0170 [Ipomoea batatas]